MIPTYPSHERPYDIELDSVGYMVVREKGVPIWEVPAIPSVAGQSPNLQEDERAYRSWHSGYGYSDFIVGDVYHYCDGGIDARYPRQIIMGPLLNSVSQTTKDGDVTGFFEKGSYLYSISGRYINRIDPSNDTVSSTSPFPYDLGASHDGTMGLPFDAYIYIVTSTSGEVVQFSGTAFVADDDSKQGNYLARFWGDTSWELAQTHLSGSTPSVAWCAQGANPLTAANWSSAYEVGDQDSTITGMVGLERTIYIAKTDGLYYMDKTGDAPRLFEAAPKDASNGKQMVLDHVGRVWYPGKSGLLIYDPSSGAVHEVTPGRGLSVRSGVTGYVTATAHYRTWHYVALYDGTNSYLMAGRERQAGEPGYGIITWHGAIGKVASAKITSLWVSSLVSPVRLWAGLSTGNLGYWKLANNGDNPLTDSDYRYAASGSIYVPADDLGVGGMRWNLMSAIIEAEGLSATTYVEVYYSLDRGTWTLLKKVTSSGRTIVTTTGDKRFNRVEMRMDVTNASATSTPIIRVLTIRASRRPELEDVVRTRLYCSPKAYSRYGIDLRKSARDMMTTLKTLDEYYPVTLIDRWDGVARSRTVLVQPVKEVLVKSEEKSDEAADLAADVTMRVIT